MGVPKEVVWTLGLEWVAVVGSRASGRGQGASGREGKLAGDTGGLLQLGLNRESEGEGERVPEVAC